MQQDLSALLHEPIVASITEALGVSKLSNGRQAELLSMLGETLVSRILLDILKTIPKEQLPEFEALQGQGDAKAVLAFMEQYADVQAVSRNAVEPTLKNLFGD